MERQKYLVEILLWSDRNTWLKNFNGERQAIKGRVHDHHLTMIIFGEAGMESVPLAALLEPRTLALLVTSDPALGPAISWER